MRMCLFFGGRLDRHCALKHVWPACTARLEMPCAVLSTLLGVRVQRHGFKASCFGSVCLARFWRLCLHVLVAAPLCACQWFVVGPSRGNVGIQTQVIKLRVCGLRKSSLSCVHEGREQLLHILVHCMSVHRQHICAKTGGCTLQALHACWWPWQGFCCGHWIHLGSELPSTARALRCVIPLTLVRIACPKQLLRRQSQVESDWSGTAGPECWACPGI